MGLAQACQQEQLSKRDTTRLMCGKGPGPAGEGGAPGQDAAAQRERMKACKEAEAVRKDRTARPQETGDTQGCGVWQM